MHKSLKTQPLKYFDNEENQDNSSSWKKMWHNIFGINNGQAMTVPGDINRSSKSRITTQASRKRKSSRQIKRKSTLLINKSFLEPERIVDKKLEGTNVQIASSINKFQPVLPNSSKIVNKDKLKVLKPNTTKDDQFHDYARFTKGRVLAKMFRRVRREVKHERAMLLRKKGKIPPTNVGNVLVRIRILTKPDEQIKHKQLEVGHVTKEGDNENCVTSGSLNADSPSYHDLEMRDFRSPKVMKLRNKERVLKTRKALRLERGVRIAMKKAYKMPTLSEEKGKSSVLNGKKATGRRIKIYKPKHIINPHFEAFEMGEQLARECQKPTAILEGTYKRVSTCQELVPYDPLWSRAIPIKPEALSITEPRKSFQTPEKSSPYTTSETPLLMQPASLLFHCTKVVKQHLNAVNTDDSKDRELNEGDKLKIQNSAKLPSKAVSALSYPFHDDAKSLNLMSSRHKRKYSELSLTKSMSRNLQNELAELKAKRDAIVPDRRPVNVAGSIPKFEEISKKVSSSSNVDQMSSTLTQMVNLIRENKELIETVMDAEKNIDHARAEILILKGRLRDYDQLLSRYDEIIDNVVKIPGDLKDSLNDQESTGPFDTISGNTNALTYSQDTEGAITKLLNKNLESLQNHQELLIKAISVESRLLAVLEDVERPNEERKITGIVEYIRHYFESATQMVNLDSIRCMVRVFYNEMMEHDNQPVPSINKSGPQRDPSFLKIFE